jgi:hypothetical protein
LSGLTEILLFASVFSLLFSALIFFGLFYSFVIPQILDDQAIQQINFIYQTPINFRKIDNCLTKIFGLTDYR